MASTRGRRESFHETASRRRAEKEALDLQADLRAFASGRPEGWGHEDWLAFLEHLKERGHDTSAADEIGAALERERLAAVLERVQGLGPRRVDSIVNRYETIWRLAQADAGDVASLPNVPRQVAERVVEAVRQERF